MFRVRSETVFLLVMSLLSSPPYAAESSYRTFYINGALGYSSMASARVYPYQFRDKQRFGYRIAAGYLFPMTQLLSVGPEVG